MKFTGVLVYSLSPEFNVNSLAFIWRHRRGFIITKFSTCIFLYLGDTVLNLEPVCCRVYTASFLLRRYRVVQAWFGQRVKLLLQRRVPPF